MKTTEELLASKANVEQLRAVALDLAKKASDANFAASKATNEYAKAREAHHLEVIEVFGPE